MPPLSNLGTPTASRTLMLCGWVLIFSGLVHVAVWLMSGQPWEGTVSWRKPALFGMSGGLTLVSLGFLQRLLAPSRWDRWLSAIMGVAMALEVGLISLQQWRGVESHFNRSTAFNASVDNAITGLISLLTVCIVVLFIRACSFLDATSDKKIAWRGGLVFLLLSCVLGFVIFAYGVIQKSNGGDPSLFGNAGVVKFPHGMTIHAIQLLPCLCWLMTRLSIPLDTRTAAVRFVNMSLACLLSLSVVQTLSGRARGDLTVMSVCILIVSVVFALPPMIVIARALAKKFSHNTLANSRTTP